MAKITLQDITAGYNASTRINANNDAIETAFENTLSRDGTSPNSMNANLDMNSNRILNLPAPTTASEPARWEDVTFATGIEIAPSQTGNAGKALKTDGSSATWAYPGSAQLPLHYDITPAEIAAGVTVIDFSIPNHESIGIVLVNRYGENTTPLTTDTTIFWEAAVLVAQEAGTPLGALPGNYLVTGTGFDITGPIELRITGVTIKNTNGNVLRVAGSGINLKGGKLWSSGGGHTIVQTAAVDQFNWSGHTLQNDATGYSVWDNAGYDYVDMRHENFLFQHVASSTVRGFNLVANGGLINDNTWEKGRCNYGSKHFFNVESNTANYQYSNSWKKITFEVCKGGGIRQTGAAGYIIKDCQNWDAGSGNIVDDFYQVLDNGHGYGGYGKIKNCGRWAGSFAAGKYDVKLASGGESAGTIIDQCYTAGGGDPFTCDLVNNAVLCMQISSTVFSTINNSGRLLISIADNGIQFPGTVNGAFLTYYDQGTFTAALEGTTAAPTTPVTITARWTRIGREVLVEGVFANANLTGATGNLKITGLPFTVGANATGVIGLSGLGTDPAVGIAVSSGTTINIVKAADIATGIPVVAAASKYVYFSLKFTV